MTFSLAFAMPDYALVANDTRLRLYPVGGVATSRMGGTDRGETGGDQAVPYRDGQSKLVALEGGWLTGGNDELLAGWTARYLLDSRAIRDEAALRALWATKVPLDAAEGHCQQLFLVQRDPDGFAIYGLDLTARDFTRMVRFALDGAVPYTDGDAEKERQCHERIQLLRAAWGTDPRNPPPLCTLLRELGALYDEVGAICGPGGSISGDVEVGLLLPAENGGVMMRRLGPLAAGVLATMPDAELERLMVPAEPYIVRASAGSRISVDSVKLTDLRVVWRGDRLLILWTGLSQLQSVKVATSTTTYPAAGTGTAADGQNGEFDAGTFGYANSVYVTVTPYAGIGATGFQGTAQRLLARLHLREDQFDFLTGRRKRTAQYDDLGYAIRAADTAGKEAFDDLFILSTKTLKVGTVAVPASITKPLRIPATECIPESDQIAFFVELAGIVRPRTANVQADLRAACVLPKGVTITTFRARMYRGTTSDTASAALRKTLDDGTSSAIATVTHATTGLATLSASLSQLVGDEMYAFTVSLKGVAAAADAQLLWFELDYTMPSYDKGY